MPIEPMRTYSTALARWSPTRTCSPISASSSAASPSPAHVSAVFGPVTGQVYSSAGSCPS